MPNLRLVSTITLPPRPVFLTFESLAATPKKKDAKIKIEYIFKDFKPLLSIGEEASPATEIAVYELDFPLADDLIVSELTKDRAVTGLSEMSALLTLQGWGEEGLLRVDGKSNVFYISDHDGDLLDIHPGWSKYDGWRIFSTEFPDERPWPSGTRIFALA